jgi:hypothetical protein
MAATTTRMVTTMDTTTGLDTFMTEWAGIRETAKSAARNTDVFRTPDKVSFFIMFY